MTQARTIIQQFGGKHQVAKFTAAKPNAIRAWYRIGIPHRYWHLFQREAEARGIAGITPDALEATRADGSAMRQGDVAVTQPAAA